MKMSTAYALMVRHLDDVEPDGDRLVGFGKLDNDTVWVEGDGAGNVRCVEVAPDSGGLFDKRRDLARAISEVSGYRLYAFEESGRVVEVVVQTYTDYDGKPREAEPAVFIDGAGVVLSSPGRPSDLYALARGAVEHGSAAALLDWVEEFHTSRTPALVTV